MNYLCFYFCSSCFELLHDIGYRVVIFEVFICADSRFSQRINEEKLMDDAHARSSHSFSIYLDRNRRFRDMVEGNVVFGGFDDVPKCVFFCSPKNSEIPKFDGCLCSILMIHCTSNIFFK
jgi:hypothetical protein